MTVATIAGWCIACLQDETRVAPTRVVNGVPLCTGCSSVFSDDTMALADMRQYMKELEPPPDEAEDDDEPEPQKAPIALIESTGSGAKCSRCGSELARTNTKGICGTCQKHPVGYDGTVKNPPAPPKQKPAAAEVPMMDVMAPSPLTLDAVREAFVSVCSVSGTARQLGVSDYVLRKFMREAGIDDPFVAWLREEESPGAGRKPGDNYKLEEREVASEALKQGASVREASGKSGLAKNTILAVREEIRGELPTTCACGKPFGHRGWCSVRVRKSHKRQETLENMHKIQRTSTVTRREQVSVELETPRGNGVERNSALTLELESGGTLRMELSCQLFVLSKRDREFVFRLADMLRSYEEGGADHSGDLRSRALTKQDEKDDLFPVMISRRFLEDLFNDCAEPAERAAVLAAWWRGDPSVKPLPSEAKK